MAFFTEISDYKTYTSEAANLHFSYNANSGGGQSFLQGKFKAANGNYVPAYNLNGFEAIFRIKTINETNNEIIIDLNDSSTKYEIKPRGDGEVNMKFAVEGKANPSKAIAAFFMLPITCGVKRMQYPDASPLCLNNYWLQSMWVDADMQENNTVYLLPKDCIFCSVDDENQDKIRCFSFDMGKRVKEIINIANLSSKVDTEISNCLHLFMDIYLGIKSFSYKECENATKSLMRFLAKKFPEMYSGFSDPLPVISRFLVSSPINDNSKTKSHIIDIEYDFRLSPYLTAIRTKPFLLLAGISGTGKSRLARQLARATAPNEWKNVQKPENYELIPVKPNWHDSTELMGYVSRISGKPEYVMTDFVRFLFKAIVYPEIPFFLCLDEMNLAPVEQYFAEYLSVIETRARNVDGKISTDVLVKFDKAIYNSSIKEQLREYYNTLSIGGDFERISNMIENDGGLRIPSNFVVIGTVNMDETTFSFSRKVLDRAMSFELNVVNMNEGVEMDNANLPVIPNEAVSPKLLSANDAYNACVPVAKVVLERLENINKELEGTPFKIAYRSRNEIMVYVYERMRDSIAMDTPDYEAAQRSSLLHQAMDEAVSMKILSRIEGDEQKIDKDFLTRLENAIKSGIAIASADDSEPVEKELYPICTAKIRQMQEQLKHGYVSFWS